MTWPHTWLVSTARGFWSALGGCQTPQECGEYVAGAGGFALLERGAAILVFNPAFVCERRDGWSCHEHADPHAARQLARSRLAVRSVNRSDHLIGIAKAPSATDS